MPFLSILPIPFLLLKLIKGYYYNVVCLILKIIDRITIKKLLILENFVYQTYQIDGICMYMLLRAINYWPFCFLKGPLKLAFINITDIIAFAKGQKITWTLVLKKF